MFLIRPQDMLLQPVLEEIRDLNRAADRTGLELLIEALHMGGLFVVHVLVGGILNCRLPGTLIPFGRRVRPICRRAPRIPRWSARDSAVRKPSISKIDGCNGS